MKYFSLIIASIFSLLIVSGCSIKGVPLTSQSSSSNPSADAETIQVSHNGSQFVPSTIKLTKGKNYNIEVTPTSNGRWCMTQVVIPGKWPQSIIKGEKFTIAVDGSEEKTIPLVCAAMGMRQGEIVVE